MVLERKKEINIENRERKGRKRRKIIFKIIKMPINAFTFDKVYDKMYNKIKEIFLKTMKI